jgi:hypothetical protein
MAERNELKSLAKQLRTPRGVKKMQTLFENAYHREYRCPM